MNAIVTDRFFQDSFLWKNDGLYLFNANVDGIYGIYDLWLCEESIRKK